MLEAFEMRNVCGCDLCFDDDYRECFRYDYASLLPHERLDMIHNYRVARYRLWEPWGT